MTSFPLSTPLSFPLSTPAGGRGLMGNTAGSLTLSKGGGLAWVAQVAGTRAALDYDFQRNRAYQNGVVSPIASIFTATRASNLTVGAADGSVVTVGNNALGLSDLGLDIHGAYTQQLLYTNDLTNAAWTKTNVTVAKTATGPDGSANSASVIAATEAGGTVLQSITLASAQRKIAARVKRRTGSGPVQMTMDGGTTWTTVPVTSSWSRVTIAAQTLANPSVGFKFLVSGDAIDVAFVNLTDSATLYPDVEATNVAVSIAASVISLPQALRDLLNTGEFTVFVSVAEVGLGRPGMVLSRNGSAATLLLNNGQFGAYAAQTSTGSVSISDATATGYYGGPRAVAVLANSSSGRSISGANSAVTTDGNNATTGVTGTWPNLGVTGGEYLEGRILRLAVWPTRYSDAIVPTITDGNDLRGIVVAGDSYSVRAPNIDLVTYVKAQFPNRACEEIGVAGETLAQAQTRVLAEDQTDRLLVLWDGYYNGYTGPVATYVDRYSAMAAKFPRSIFLPPVVMGSDTTLTASDVTTTAQIKSEMISRGLNVIDPNAVLSIFGDGSANDNADIAAGRIPRSLSNDPVGDPIHMSATAIREIGVAVRVMADQLGY